MSWHERRKQVILTPKEWIQIVLGLGLLEVTLPPTECNSYLVNPLPPGRVRWPGFRVTGSVYAHDQWHSDIEFSCRQQHSLVLHGTVT